MYTVARIKLIMINITEKGWNMLQGAVGKESLTEAVNIRDVGGGEHVNIGHENRVAFRKLGNDGESNISWSEVVEWRDDGDEVRLASGWVDIRGVLETK